MRPTYIRILKHGLLTAAILAALGYLMAEVAGTWVAAQAVPRAGAVGPGGEQTPADGAAVAAALRVRMPLIMAAWGFGLVAAFELVLRMWRGKAPPAPPTPARPAIPTEDEVEQLLNQLLQQAEAAEAARKAGVSPSAPTPPPAEGLPTGPVPPAANQPG